MLKPFLGTLCGAAIGLLAILLWILTFNPHAGREWSSYLFPLSSLVLRDLYPTQSIPVPLWYAGALLQWLLLGALVDIRRGLFQKRSQPANPD